MAHGEKKMSKAFWQGFEEGFAKASGYGLAFAAGMVFLYLIYEHPYDRCLNQHITVEDISECIWSSTNP